MIMVHSDNQGLVLPPKVAQTQIVVIPIFKKGDDVDKLRATAKEITAKLVAAGFKVECDDSDQKNPGFKYNYWEQRGTPVRLELGKMDLDKAEVRCVVRHSGNKKQVKQADISKEMHEELEQIHKDMYQKALDARLQHMLEVDNWEDFMKAVSARNICMAPWCDTKACEEAAKERSKAESLAASISPDAVAEEAMLTGAAKTLCIPFEASGLQKPIPAGTKCFTGCGKDAKVRALWGRSY